MSNTVEISLEAVLSTDNRERAWAAVKANAGAGGVDGKGIAETEAHLKRHWPVIREKLLRGDYRPAAVGWTGSWNNGACRWCVTPTTSPYS